MLYSFRDPRTVHRLADKIKELSKGTTFRLMHVCGTHEQSISRWGLRDILPKNLEIVAGPGCPVCCTPLSDIDLSIELASKGYIITTFGDMFGVPGTKTSLAEIRAKGKDVRIVYSIQDAVNLAKENKGRQVVHCAIGFETTAPSTAIIILNTPPSNFSIICSHKLIPPAMEALLIGKECRIDGFIAPGHVSTIIGSKPYEPLAKIYKKPIVIAGFEPIDILYGIFLILKQFKDGRQNVEIEYRRSVAPKGNPLAIKLLRSVFDICGSNWRGLGFIPKSGLQLKKKFEKFDAEKLFSFKRATGNACLPVRQGHRATKCRCGDILKGLISPLDCPLFSKTCKPDNPIGPCMVSSEGACNAYYKYRK
jgi:hydrogenase expression/formation protein HypD